METVLERLLAEGLKGRGPSRKEAPLIDILYEDGAIVALNKPAGITSVPGSVETQGTYYHELKDYFERRPGEHFTPRILHRLDKQTSGLMVIGKHEEAERSVSLQFERHEVVKEYLAVVGGEVADEKGEINLRIAPDRRDHGRMIADDVTGKEALTRYEVLDRFRGFSLLCVQPQTGRTHQIRVHLAAIGHPVLVDGVYGSGEPVRLSEFKRGYKARQRREERPLLNRHALHSRRITLASPDTGSQVTVEAPLPRDLALLLRQLDKFGR